MSAEASAPQLPGDSFCGDKEFAVEVLEPDRQYMREHDFSFRHTTVCHCLRGVPDADLLREALQRVLTKNPVVAGRLRPSFGAESTWQPEGLEISFDGPLGVHFQVRPMSAELEAEVESLTGERCAQEFLHVHTELAEALGVGRVAFALDLIGRDRPLCVATYTPGKRVSVVALSLSRLFGEAAALNDLLRRWDEEFAAPNSTAPLSGGTCEPDEGGEAVMRMLCKPLYALQAVTEVLDGARHWLYELGCRGVAGCCADRPVTSSPDHARIAAPGQHLDGRSLKERKPQVEDDSAPEDREFYAIAVRVREETITSFRAAAAASAPPGDSASAGSPVEALGAWLGNVLRAPRPCLCCSKPLDAVATHQKTAAPTYSMKAVRSLKANGAPKLPAIAARYDSGSSSASDQDDLQSEGSRSSLPLPPRTSSTTAEGQAPLPRLSRSPPLAQNNADLQGNSWEEDRLRARRLMESQVPVPFNEGFPMTAAIAKRKTLPRKLPSLKAFEDDPRELEARGGGGSTGAAHGHFAGGAGLLRSPDRAMEACNRHATKKPLSCRSFDVGMHDRTLLTINVLRRALPCALVASALTDRCGLSLLGRWFGPTKESSWASAARSL
ncbi:hypothetical protein AK812_SmicGene20425 [Symbiodinium microadriaticum]|uniref:Uncharacterized protein n=1 Tax=Symbiodinium microadriaticum TaxID=2951 RepID=A0A1Q9DQ04_SYMMI|nr:hypothetical protein AK812_SmicGene20425 [Symbiodinium microadriaticum]